jgi:O-antigen ligase
MVWVMLFSAVYLIYWGNMEYFEGRMMGLHWTLMGPGYEYLMTAYVDENTFAMFFVMAIPFLYFMGSYYKNRALRYLFWVAIPFAWHCIFLTGSRGGLLGLFVVTLYMIIRSKSKILSVVIPAALVLAFIYQSGAIMKGRVEKAIDVEQDSSAQNRMNSWEAGIKMMIDHPITGIGIGNFVKAYPHYSNTKPFVAHNTIIQLSAESGVGAGLMYLLICSGIFMTFFKQKKLEAFNIDPFISVLNDSVTGSLAGYFVCALFLNLGNYEIFYYLLILHSVRTRLVSIALKNISSNKIKSEMSQ